MKDKWGFLQVSLLVEPLMYPVDTPFGTFRSETELQEAILDLTDGGQNDPEKTFFLIGEIKSLAEVQQGLRQKLALAEVRQDGEVCHAHGSDQFGLTSEQISR